MARDINKEGFLNNTRELKPEGHQMLVVMKVAPLKTYEGNILHVDKAKNAVYQLDSSAKKPTLVKHDLSVFKGKEPTIGALAKIEYTRGQAQVASQDREKSR